MELATATEHLQCKGRTHHTSDPPAFLPPSPTQGLRIFSKEFYDLSVELATATEHLQCKGRTQDPHSRYVGTVLTGSAALAIGAALFAVFPRLRRSGAQQQQRGGLRHHTSGGW